MFSFWTKHVLKNKPQQLIRAVFLLFSSCKKPEAKKTGCCCFQSSIVWVELSHLRCLKLATAKRNLEFQLHSSSVWFKLLDPRLTSAVPSLSEAASLSLWTSLSLNVSLSALLSSDPPVIYTEECAWPQIFVMVAGPASLLLHSKTSLLILANVFRSEPLSSLRSSTRRVFPRLKSQKMSRINSVFTCAECCCLFMLANQSKVVKWRCFPMFLSYFYTVSWTFFTTFQQIRLKVETINDNLGKIPAL